MFGKKTMSSNAKFIMQAGRDVGNLKGRGKAKKTAPVTGKAPVSKQMPAGNVDRLTGPSRDKGVSLGQGQTFSTSVSRRQDRHK